MNINLILQKCFYDLCISFSKNRDKHVSVYAKNISGVAFLSNSDFSDVIKNPSKPLTEEEFVQLNYHEIKDLDIPYHDYWYHTEQEGAASLNLAGNKKANEEMIIDNNIFFIIKFNFKLCFSMFLPKNTLYKNVLRW